MRTEIVASITTFLTMAYILAVNPNIFDALGGAMSKADGAVFTATALAAIIGTLAMAFIAKKPFALAPGMGLNAFFVYTVCITMGHTWEFALALLFAPVFLAIPSAATAPALIIVGMMMMSPVMKIKWDDYTEAIPAFITLIMMPLSYSISDGILIGMISYVLLNACCGRFSKITITMWVLAVLFILRYIFI